MSVKEAESILSKLEAKRTACIARGTELADERTALSFAAHAEGDTKAKTRLEAVHLAISQHASELASLDAALRAAAERLEHAKRHEEQKADREAAKELRKTCSQFLALAQQADEAAATFIATCSELERLGAAMSAQGLPPTGQQRVAFYSRAVWTALMGLPQAWRRGDDFRVLGYNEKRSFTGPTAEWAAAAERNITARLSEPKGETTNVNAA